MRTKKHATESMQVQMGILDKKLDKYVFDIVDTQWHERSNYKKLETNTRKPELNDGRHQATLFLFLYSWGCVQEEPRSMKFTSRCQRRLTHAHLEDHINNELAQLFISSILFMTLMKKFLNSFFDGKWSLRCNVFRNNQLCNLGCLLSSLL
jgi:hypothetical protein